MAKFEKLNVQDISVQSRVKRKPLEVSVLASSGQLRAWRAFTYMNPLLLLIHSWNALLLYEQEETIQNLRTRVCSVWLPHILSVLLLQYLEDLCSSFPTLLLALIVHNPSSFTSLCTETSFSLLLSALLSFEPPHHTELWQLQTFWEPFTSSSFLPVPVVASEPVLPLAFNPNDPYQSPPLLRQGANKSHTLARQLLCYSWTFALPWFLWPSLLYSAFSVKVSLGASLLRMSSSCHQKPLSEGASGTSTFSCILHQQIQVKNRHQYQVQKLGSQTYFLQPPAKSCPPLLLDWVQEAWLLAPLTDMASFLFCATRFASAASWSSFEGKLFMMLTLFLFCLNFLYSRCRCWVLWGLFPSQQRSLSASC